MGVPKFFRWLSERYPKINQRMTLEASDELSQKYFQRDTPAPWDPPDPLSTCGLPPPIDRLYMDMNGILHGCSHNNMDELGTSTLREDEIFKNVCYYLERIVGEMAQPTTLVYMAIDGVAPRAKLNQQRSRRYRSSDGGEIEQTVFDAHFKNKSASSTTPKAEQVFVVSDDKLKVTDEGYVSGKFETHQAVTSPSDRSFHSNSITPGTPFFANCQEHLEHFIKYKMSTDPKWQKLTIIFSGSHVPGEGEHKIMDFMRRERTRPDYDPNTRHCIVGQDGDLIMLGLATHEPNLVLLRERVVFDMNKSAQQIGIDSYIYNPHFEFLHINVLRDYLAFEFETAPLTANSIWNHERTIDDFVFLTFFCGNDFLPHLPAVDIGDEAFELLFYTYKKCRRGWEQESGKDEYLTDRGNICSGARLEHFLQTLGSHESPYYDNKKEQKTRVNQKIRSSDSTAGRESTIPPEEVLQSKEAEDRALYRDMLATTNVNSAVSAFTPVLSSPDLPFFRASTEDEEMEAGFFAKLGKMVHSSLTDSGETSTTFSMSNEFLNDQDLKGRYYYDKFRFTPFDAEKHIALRKSYLEGLVWNLKYYYEGCVSWEWFYPYHYGPMLSDIVNVEQMLDEISFDGKLGEPLKPFEQLMGCMPPSSSYMLPEPYRWLMTEETSPIHEFYPLSFTVDMNGKRWPWEAVVLLPFIDSTKLIHAARNFVKDEQLSAEEMKRNTLGNAVVYTHDPSVTERIPPLTSGIHCFEAMDESFCRSVPLASTNWDYNPKGTAVFEPTLKEGIVYPQAGYSTLKVVPITNLWKRRVGLNVFGMRSRYRTAVLQLAEDFAPPSPPITNLAAKLIGVDVHINYPHFLEGYVTSVSNEDMIIRGHEAPRMWTVKERQDWIQRSNTLTNKLESGEGFTGTGGWNVPGSKITFSVRPVKEILSLEDGMQVKSYAKFEVEVPMIAGSWSPAQKDSRLAAIPRRLEKDLYFVKKTMRKADVNTSASDLPSNSDLLPSELLPDADKAFDGPIMTSLSDLFVSGEHTSESLLPPMDLLHPLSNLSSTASILPPMNIGSSRKFSTRSAPRPLIPGGTTRRFSTAARARPTSGAPRGRLLGMAAFVFASSVAVVNAGWTAVARGAPGDDATPWHTTPPPPLEFAHGTTTLSFVFQGGIIAAVDSRASLGNFVGSKTVQKVLCIHTHMLGTMAGGAADCSFWIRKLQGQADLLELTSNHRMSVARASRILSNALYENRGLDLSVGTMIMGQDEGGEFSIYYVDNSGVRIKGDLFSCGSGSTFALGILDQERTFEMTEDEAIALGVKAIRHATFRDAFSGGFIGVYLITKEGWRKVFSEDLALSGVDLKKGEEVTMMVQ